MSAIILALVPFVRWFIERIFRWLYTDSAAEAIRSGANDSRETIKAIALNSDLITVLSLYIKNWSGMEKFFQTCIFATLSIVVLMVTEDMSSKPRLFISFGLLVMIIVMLFIAALRGMRRIDFATEGSIKWYSRCAYYLDLAVLVFVAFVKLASLKFPPA